MSSRKKDYPDIIPGKHSRDTSQTRQANVSAALLIYVNVVQKDPFIFGVKMNMNGVR